MSQIRKIAVAGGTFAAALGIGFVVQNGDALASRLAGEPEVVAAPVAMVPMVELPAFEAPQVENSTALVAQLPKPISSFDPTLEPQLLAAVAAEDFGVTSDAPALTTIASTGDCTPRMLLSAAEGAMVEVNLDAPCAADQIVTIHHQGMMFTAATDADGLYSTQIPALAKAPVVMASFMDGSTAVGATFVSDFDDYHRAVLLWQGDTGLELHAFIDGATYGDPLHLTTVGNTSAGGAVMQRFGEDLVAEANFSEVFSIPTFGAEDGSKSVRFSVEAEITAENFGREISAQTLEFAAASDLKALDLSLSIPSCDAVGDFILLGSLISPVHLAMQ